MEKSAASQPQPGLCDVNQQFPSVAVRDAGSTIAAADAGNLLSNMLLSSFK
jgi:hypothetical protein